MAFTLTEIPKQGGGWFTPTEVTKSYPAFLIEVKDWEPQRPGQFGPKDSALVDLTIFTTEEELDAGEPSILHVGIRVEYTCLTRDLQSLYDPMTRKGQATVQRIDQAAPSKPGQRPAWIWEDVTPAVKKKVIAYGIAREAAADAALADVPDF